MGSSQSAPPSPQRRQSTATGYAKTDNVVHDRTSDEAATETSSRQRGSSRPPPRPPVADPKEKTLSGMDLVNYKCRRKHKAYKTCVKQWYQGEFLSAKSVDQDEACAHEFERYQKCVLKGIRKEVYEKQFGGRPPLPDSPLAELENEEKEQQQDRGGGGE